MLYFGNFIYKYVAKIISLMYWSDFWESEVLLTQNASTTRRRMTQRIRHNDGILGCSTPMVLFVFLNIPNRFGELVLKLTVALSVSSTNARRQDGFLTGSYFGQNRI